MCVPLLHDKSNNISQMKTTFKKINPRNKLWVSTHSPSDYKSANYNNNYQQTPHSREDYKNPPTPEDKCYLLRLWAEGPQSI